VIVDGDLELVAQLGHRLAHLHDAGEVELRREVEGRNGTDRLAESARDGLADVRERLVVEVALARNDRPTRRSRGCGALHGDAGRRSGFDVALDDAAVGARALNAVQIEAALGRESARERRGTDVTGGGRSGRRGTRRWTGVT